MELLDKKIINWCKKKIRTRSEIMKYFNIPYEKRETLRRRLKELDIETKDARGRPKIKI